MAEASNIERIREYLHQYRNHYELATLRTQLLGAGYPAADVDAAIASFEQNIGVVPSSQAEGMHASVQNAERERAIGEMVAYLRQHGAQYDLDALRRQLLQAGQPVDAVDEAVRRAGLPPRRSGGDGPAWPWGLLIALLNVVVLPSIATVLVVLGGSDSAVAIFSLVPSLVLLVEFVVGLVLVTRGPRYRLGRVLLWGVLFSLVVPFLLFIGFVLLVILVGIGVFTSPGFTSP